MKRLNDMQTAGKVAREAHSYPAPRHLKKLNPAAAEAEADLAAAAAAAGHGGASGGGTGGGYMPVAPLGRSGLPSPGPGGSRQDGGGGGGGGGPLALPSPGGDGGGGGGAAADGAGGAEGGGGQQVVAGGGGGGGVDLSASTLQLVEQVQATIGRLTGKIEALQVSERAGAGSKGGRSGKGPWLTSVKGSQPHCPSPCATVFGGGGGSMHSQPSSSNCESLSQGYGQGRGLPETCPRHGCGCRPHFTRCAHAPTPTATMPAIPIPTVTSTHTTIPVRSGPARRARWARSTRGWGEWRPTPTSSAPARPWVAWARTLAAPTRTSSTWTSRAACRPRCSPGGHVDPGVVLAGM